MQILLAEDDRILRDTLKDQLERKGHPVQAVGDGQQAWRALDEGHFDLALLDWKLPGPDGLALAQHIRARQGGNTYVVLMTGHDALLEARALAESGVDAYLMKPLNACLLEKQLAMAEQFLKIEGARKQKEAGLRQSEERLALLVHQSPIAFIEADTSGRVVLWNPAAEAVFGYAASEVLGQPVLRFLLLPEDQGHGDSLWRDLLQHRGVSHCTREGRNRNGGRLLFSIYHTPLLAPDGELQGLLAVVEDITTRTKEAGVLSESRKMQLMETLAGGFAHDFAHLVTSIEASVEIARSGLPAGSTVERPLSQIQGATEEAARLCQQLLAYSGQDRSTFVPLNLNAVVGGAMRDLRAMFPDQRSLEFHAGEGPLGIEGDRGSLTRALAALVQNAHEAMAPMDGPIVLRTGSLWADYLTLAQARGADGLAEGDYCWVEVRDAGRGLDPDTQDRIFDPFFSTKALGRGLGLSAVLGITRTHHGGILVESDPHQGCAFRLLLPRRTFPGAVAEPPTQPRTQDVSAPRILLVDDEEATRTVLAEALGVLGFRTLEAGNGQEALDLFRAHKGEIDAVLMDLSMPVMDGARALMALRELQPDVRVLLMSAYTQDEAASRYVGLGMASFISKPFKMKDLKQKLKEVLASQSHHRQA